MSLPLVFALYLAMLPVPGILCEPPALPKHCAEDRGNRRARRRDRALSRAA